MNDISTKVRVIIGICVIIVLLGISAGFYLGGLVIGIMGTDACGSRLSGAVSLYLVLFWPIVMALCSIIPPAMFMKGVKWRWTLVALFLGMLISALWYFGWFLIIAMYCSN